MRSCQRGPTIAAFSRNGSAARRAKRAPGGFRERLSVPKPEDKKRSGARRGLRRGCGRVRGPACRDDRARGHESARFLSGKRPHFVSTFRRETLSLGSYPNHKRPMKPVSKILAVALSAAAVLLPHPTAVAAGS